MGRVVRNILSEWITEKNARFLFAIRKEADREVLQKWLSILQPDAQQEIVTLEQLRVATVDGCWYPWNRVDVLPRAGRRIVTINDVNPFVFPYRSLLRRWDQFKDERRFRQAAQLADQVVTISDFSRREISKYLHVDVAKIEVVYLGVDEKWFGETADQQDRWQRSAATSAAANCAPQLLYVGADDERKNLRNLLGALPILQDETGIAARLTCCGTGPDAAAKYQPLLQAAGIAERVEFTGFVSETALRNYYQAADLFVFPSTYEGFGLPLLEAMAAGLPVVSSQAASLPEVGGDAAVYFDPHDPAAIAAAIADTWSRRDHLRQMATRGKQRAAEFTWRKAADQLWDIVTLSNG